jgi:diacylglycerol kinase (ATP)
MRVAVIINPRAGRGRRGEAAAALAAVASAVLEARGVAGEVQVSERPGHAHELARRAIEAGSTLVVAWGGDGTVNEVGAAVAFTPAALGIVPAGSGNGLARMLGLPRQPRRALEAALDGRDRLIDGGECNGRLFFNVAGVGLDAEIAARFAVAGRRGFLSYLGLTLRELFRYRPAHYRIGCDGEQRISHAWLVVAANGREFGNGARIAPHARIDDGLLDLVVIEARSVLRALWDLPRLYTGSVLRARGVWTRRIRAVEIAGAGPLTYHVDGEVGTGGAELHVRVHPGALRVRVPR